jgi:hypothetical protein
MRIPSRFQIFENEVLLTDKDAERLQVHLSNWRRLHEILLLGVNVEDLRRLVILELIGNGRRFILTRLLGRIAKLQRQETMQRINRVLG